MFYEIYVDGAARGQGTANPGVAACACTIYRNKKKIGQYARGLGERTNNEAEYEAILLGLLLAWASDLKDPTIYSDSALAVNQITGTWECKSPALVPLLMSIEDLKAEFPFRIVAVPRKDVGDADELVNEFLDGLAIRNGKKPRKRK